MALLTKCLVAVFLLGGGFNFAFAQAKEAKTTKPAAKKGKKMSDTVTVIMDTSMGGPIEIELYADKAPETVKNFFPCYNDS